MRHSKYDIDKKFNALMISRALHMPINFQLSLGIGGGSDFYSFIAKDCYPSKLFVLAKLKKLFIQATLDAAILDGKHSQFPDYQVQWTFT